MIIHVLQHLDFETAGAISEWASHRSHELRIIRVDLGEILPRPGETHLLIVLGGFFEFSTHGPPWFENEKKILRAHMDAETKIFAICGGAQLMTFLMGGSIFASAEPEIGWHSLLYEDVRYLAFHWHSYSFSLPPRSRSVSSSIATDVQGFRFGKHSLAVQFHPDITDQLVRAFNLRLSTPSSLSRHVQTEAEMMQQLELGMKSSLLLLEKILSSFEE